MNLDPLKLPHPVRDVRLARHPAPTAGSSRGPASDLRAAEDAAYQRGRREAESELQSQLIQQRSEMAALSQGILRSLRDSAAEVVRQSEGLLVDLALEMSSRLLSGQPLDAARISANVREALLQVEEATEIRVQVHPEDLALLQQLAEGERPESGIPGPVLWVPTSAVQRGGCLVQTRFGFIDNQPDTKLRTLKAAVAA